MTKFFTTALLAIGLTAAGDAHAYRKFCKSHVRSQTQGSGNTFRAVAAFCSEIASFTDGWRNDVDIEVIGPNRVSVISLGDGGRTVLRLKGADAVLGVLNRNGGHVDVRSRGRLEGTILNDGGKVRLSNTSNDHVTVIAR